MNKDVRQYIEKQKSPQKEICTQLRKLIIDTIPNSNEEMRWGVPSFDDGKIYFVALKDHVNLGLVIDGKAKKVIKIKSLDEIDHKQITGLLK